jgi:hypothetical protein
VLVRLLLLTICFFPDYNFTCNNNFEGGGWLLVRYNSFGSQPHWFRATDGLRGTDVYGYPGLEEYSIYYKHLLKPESELLFVIGLLLLGFVLGFLPNP